MLERARERVGDTNEGDKPKRKEEEDAVWNPRGNVDERARLGSDGSAHRSFLFSELARRGITNVYQERMRVDV